MSVHTELATYVVRQSAKGISFDTEWDIEDLAEEFGLDTDTVRDIVASAL